MGVTDFNLCGLKKKLTNQNITKLLKFNSKLFNIWR